ncbi:hypothetical protein [Catenibacterium sp.]|uniref:hypothetical protein n=1 Tax=Catenibacterium sp. TaxID=2049022 RepID=UPI0039917380
MSSFIAELNNGFSSEPEENVFSSIWNEYERVIMQSLITSFGLDFLVPDQHGGDVDTIHSVREIGKDPNMTYKNAQNQADYANRGEYNTYEYHQDPRYISINRRVSESKKNGTLTDTYTGQKVAQNANIDLDHAISAKEIHDDPGRVLAGLNGTDLANCNENLKPTDRSINRSMQNKDMEDYLHKWEEERPQRQSRISELKSKGSLSDKERKELDKLEKLEQIDPDKMRAENKKARAAYEAKLAKAYYTSPKFLKDTAVAAGSRGAEMGMRQAMGFVFIEIWMSSKEEIQALPPGKDLKDMLETVASGVKKGVENAKIKDKEILAKFGEGFLSGTLASLTTTICNIFFTTAKNLVKCIRQIYASVVEAGKILLFNPDNLMFGDRIKTSTIILATGASVLVGTAVGELVQKTPIATIPGVGSFVTAFCSSLVSGLISCTLLIFLDRSKFMNKVVSALNRIPSEVNNYKEIADAMERLSAKLENLDIAKFCAETEKYRNIATKIGGMKSEQELNDLLLSAYKMFDIKIPWEGDFDTFMGNKSNHLVFE